MLNSSVRPTVNTNSIQIIDVQSLSTEQIEAMSNPNESAENSFQSGDERTEKQALQQDSLDNEKNFQDIPMQQEMIIESEELVAELKEPDNDFNEPVSEPEKSIVEPEETVIECQESSVIEKKEIAEKIEDITMPSVLSASVISKNDVTAVHQEPLVQEDQIQEIEEKEELHKQLIENDIKEDKRHDLDTDEEDEKEVSSNNKKTTTKQVEDDDDDNSVCVLVSSGDEEDDEEERRVYDDEGCSEEDDEGEVDSEEEDDDEYDEDDSNADYIMDSSGRFVKERYIEERRAGRRYVDEDEIEDSEYIDDHYEESMEAEHFDGNSDDKYIRSGNDTGDLRQLQKERSHSLQDLSKIKGQNTKNALNPYSLLMEKKQQGLRAQYENEKQYQEACHMLRNNPDIELHPRRISAEKKKEEQSEGSTSNSELKQLKVNSQDTPKTDKISRNNQNGEENGLEWYPCEEMQVEPEHVQEKSRNMNVNRMLNGTQIPPANDKILLEKKGGIKRSQENDILVNGEEGTKNSLQNVRTLSYHEYMECAASADETRNISKGSKLEVIAENENSNKEIDISEEKTIDDMINSEVEISKGNQTADIYQRSNELVAMKAQLDQRNIQFENLSQACHNLMQENMALKMEYENFEKTVDENTELKIEVDKLNKIVTNLKKKLEKQISAVNTIAIQTDPMFIPKPADKALLHQQNNSDTSGTSAETQWSETVVSAVSIDPPNLTAAINSDESVNQDSKSMKDKNIFSKGYMTTSRILQKLAEITQRGKPSSKLTEKSIVDDYVLVDNEKTGDNNSKKRKASTDTNLAPPIKRQRESEQSTSDKDNDKTRDEDDIKVFSYRDDGTGIENSFLIQAKEVSDNPKLGRRECGPYRLGNIEVYMTEVNGTINIWGKEVSENETHFDELDTTVKSKFLKSGLYQQSTPRALLFNETSASTGKKSRVVPRFLNEIKSQHACSSSGMNCEHCSPHSPHYYDAVSHNHHHHNHSCCTSGSSINENDHHCKCVHVKQINRCCDNIHTNERTNIKPCCSKSHCPINETSDCSQRNSVVRRHSFNDVDMEDDEESFEDVDNKPTRNTRHHTHSFGNRLPTSNSNLKKQIENLLQEQQNPELLDVRKKVPSGRSVKGIVRDLLKGCCQNPRTSSTYRSTAAAPRRSSPAPINEAIDKQFPDKSTLNPQDIVADTEIQQYKDELERVRKQSDNLKEMLNTMLQNMN